MQDFDTPAWLAAITLAYAFILLDTGTLAGGTQFSAAWFALFVMAMSAALLTSSRTLFPAASSGLLAAAIYAAVASRSAHLVSFPD